MIALALWHRLAQMLDRIAQGDELLATGQHDGIVEPLAPAVGLTHAAALGGHMEPVAPWPLLARTEN
jgi:hypothetical protein